MSSWPPPPPPPAPPPPHVWAVAPRQPKPGPAPGLEYAGFWIRFVAALVDGTLFSIVVLPIEALIGVFNTPVCTEDLVTRSLHCSLAWLTPGYIALWIASWTAGIAYYVGLWSHGGTVGMRAMKLSVVDAATGGPISLGRAGVRYIGYLLSGLALGLGLMWAGWDKRKQGWHDKMARTLVVRKVV